ncbi:uncharacterized protein LOC128667534 [Microplitis demolitor]|uniref:uncharacterized protein LOC128667534 n=1 Tax=Microplitis demolitor TaxID=69319 RepID=UPI00235B67FC|nr:uncharacterized protein LOC128667534 [Microplitis demolitor]
MSEPPIIDVNLALIVKKRNILTRYLNKIAGLVNAQQISDLQASLRFERVKPLFREYEELVNELIEAQPTSDESEHFDQVSNAYYGLEEHLTPDEAEVPAHNSTTIGNTTQTEKQTLQKLPVPQLPTFSGDYNEWISFSNLFRGIIDKRDDIANIVKFQYLKTCVKGEAAQRIIHLQASDENYQVAWTILKGTYELKRVLRNKHIGAIFELKKPETANPATLGHILNTVRQNLTSLETLGSQPAHDCFIWHLERILPDSVSEKWQDTLKPDDSPTVEDMFKFLEATISRMHTKSASNTKNSNANKRTFTGFPNQSKTFKNADGDRALVIATKSCDYCRATDHYLYQCREFDKLTIPKRWEFVKQRNLCRNCLGKNHSPCTSRYHCKHCTKFHHSKLHSTKSSLGGDHQKRKDPPK